MSRLFAKTTKNAICVFHLLSYLCKWSNSTLVESGLTCMGILISCQAVMGRAVCVLEEFKHGIVFAWMLLGNEFIVTMKICIYICSYGTKRDGLLICFRSVIVSLIFPYSCLQLSICNA